MQMFSQAAFPPSITRVKAVSFRTVEDGRINVYVVQFNFSRDGNAGAPYSSIKLIGAGFGQTDPTADFRFCTTVGMDF